MKSINSSVFGRFFGHATKLSFDTHNITLVVNGHQSVIAWHSLLSPPKFRSRLWGKNISFDTPQKKYTLTKMAFRPAINLQLHGEKLWIEANKKRLQNLLINIDKYISQKYLRKSSVQHIKLAIQEEYSRWFPWVAQGEVGAEISILIDLLSDYQHWSKTDIEVRREAYINQQLSLFKTFFDNVETNPLTLKQRRACVIDDDNNLLLAGAGTGKTSVMVGRAGYLLKSLQAQHSDILLLAYGRAAADEMDARIVDKLRTDKISATTFHGLGLSIIAQVEGGKPSLSVFAEDDKAKAKWIQTYFEGLIYNNEAYCTLILEYFSKYYYVEKNDFEFESLGDYYQYLIDNDIRTLKGERVKSFGELYIANWLFNHGIEYQYEANYAFDVKNIEHRQYRPDFFLVELNIYIEYYGIDENGDTAPYINRDQYQASMQWKRQTHQHYKTQCIELTYAHHKKGFLLKNLAKCLKSKHIEYKLLPPEAMLASLKESGRISVLAEIFTKLVSLYKNACLDAELEENIIRTSKDNKQMAKAFELLQPILKAYQAHLLSRDEIDFEDMISKALMYVHNGQFKPAWRYIMVDEFQDISEPRARLVKALRENCQGSSIFAVGDDWQAIYRFNGADVTLTTGFSNYFGNTTQTELDCTFRFNNKIAQVATDFISKNPSQIHKTIIANEQVNSPAISLLCKRALTYSTPNRIDEIVNGALNEVLTAIARKVNKPTSVYLLARFWFLLPDKATLTHLNQQYPILKIQTQSFHTAKGKEADQVVIMGMKTGKHGFPTSKATPAILDALLAKEEKFEHAEERRLFYVALTRAKNRVYIIADMQNMSVFVQELISEYDIELNEFDCESLQKQSHQSHCLVCKTGILKAGVSRYGSFYYCSHFPLCEHKERACTKCQSIMTKTKYVGFKACLNPSCQDVVPLCDKCGAEMLLRKSKKGEFWGCRNYRGNDANSCKNGIDKSKIKWPVLSH